MIVGHVVELLLLSFHLSVLVCVLRERSKGPAAFRSGFFAIYCVQSVADIGEYILALVFVRLAVAGYMPQAAFDFPQGAIALFCLTYSVQIEFAAHSAVALNRFFVLTDAWTDRKERVLLCAILLLPLPIAALRLVGGMTLVKTSVPGVYGIMRDIRWVNTATAVTTTLTSLLTSAVSFTYELRSLLVYKRLTASARKKYRNDFLLLIYALLQFAIQLGISVCYGMSTYGSLIDDPEMMSVGTAVVKHLSICLCLSPPVCVFSTSKVLRTAYFRMYSPFGKSSIATASDRVEHIVRGKNATPRAA